MVPKAAVRLDPRGVPILSATRIEEKADEIIRAYAPECLIFPSVVPVRWFIEIMSIRYGVKYLESDLGVLESGEKVLGKFRRSDRTIEIDVSVVGTDRYPFTLAHEFAHLILHRNAPVSPEDYGVIRDVERDYVTGKKQLNTPREWIEWQANHLAACILMPRCMFKKAVYQHQIRSGIRRNLGHVFLDHQPVNYAAYLGVLHAASGTFGVSHSNVDVRLAELGILQDRRFQGVSHVSEFLRAG